MFHQTFVFPDIFRVLVLGFLEWVLSADNILVLAILVRPLTIELQKKALFVGILSAFFLRFIAILGASFLIQFAWIQILGALYLLYLSIHHFLTHKKHSSFSLKKPTFWKIVIAIEFFDLSFAIDSIVSGLSFIAPYSSSSSPINPKLWVLLLGAIIGIIGVRYAAHFFTSVLKRFPALEPSTYLLVGWIGLHLFFDGLFKFYGLNLDQFLWPVLLFWVGTVFFLMLGFLLKRNYGK
ncbi:MAG TPA: hypothetical protein VLG44_04325 [Chlamydiales bacterium]|nr:hypothetical protein [Chlamydiales bacterium]